MLDSVLASTTGAILPVEILWCTLTSLGLGIVIALLYVYKNTYNRNFVLTLALLPVLVQSVILVVNGNLGAGVAVMGAFSLVRFRSIPGSAREIGSIFFAMAAGLATGMGYLAYAALFTAIVGAAMLLFLALNLGGAGATARTLRITLPEDTDYTGLFDDVMAEYTRHAQLDRVRTLGLGSLFELQYTLQLKDTAREKAFIDEVRKRNGNLNISCARPGIGREETL